MILSKAQKDVVEELKKEGVYLWTNEGNNFQAWLGDCDGKKMKKVNIATAKSLDGKGVIRFVDGNYRDGIYKYTLIKDYLNK